MVGNLGIGNIWDVSYRLEDTYFDGSGLYIYYDKKEDKLVKKYANFDVFDVKSVEGLKNSKYNVGKFELAVLFVMWFFLGFFTVIIVPVITYFRNKSNKKLNKIINEVEYIQESEYRIEADPLGDVDRLIGTRCPECDNLYIIGIHKRCPYCDRKIDFVSLHKN